MTNSTSCLPVRSAIPLIRRKQKPLRQNWKPNLFLRVLYAAWRVAFGAFKIARGSSSFGTLTALLQLFSNIQGPFAALSQCIPQIISAIGATERIMEIESLASENLSKSKLKDMTANLLVETPNETDTIEEELMSTVEMALNKFIEMKQVEGEKLVADAKYFWDVMESAFSENKQGDFGTDEIKMLRLILTVDLKVAKRVKLDDGMTDRIVRFARIASVV